jgi:regulator of protease activity HflC (stomatin/prohibitin superfamily)
MFGFRFMKFQPNDFVLQYRNGKVVKYGPGLSLVYYAAMSSLVVVPMGSVEIPFIFEEMTSDFQTVTVQGQVTYRIVDPKKISGLLNYTLDSKGRKYVSDDPQKLPQRIINIVKVLAKKQIQSMELKDAIKSSEVLAGGITADIQSNMEITSLGIETLGLFILSILPNKETSRALEAEAREEILRRADQAIYERRNASVEQERKIKENELNTEIAVENKKKQIKEAQMDAEKVMQERHHELQDVDMSFNISQEEKKKTLVELSAQNSRTESDAKAYEISAVMKSLENVNPGILQSLASMGMEPNKLIALAFQGLADKAEKIGQLNISPDLLQELIKDNR